MEVVAQDGLQQVEVNHTRQATMHGDFARAVADADARLHTADYVEARGILLPAIEYLKKAVDAAETQSRLGGRPSFIRESPLEGSQEYSMCHDQYILTRVRLPKPT